MPQAFLCAAVCILLIMAAEQATWPCQLNFALQTGHLRFRCIDQCWNFCGICKSWSDEHHIQTPSHARNCQYWHEKDEEFKMHTLVSGLCNKGKCCKPYSASRMFWTLCKEVPHVLTMRDEAWKFHTEFYGDAEAQVSDFIAQGTS